MRKNFPLFQGHLDLSRKYLTSFLQKGMSVIDATMGNGHDCLFLCEQVLSDGEGFVWAYDIQVAALKSTKERISSSLSESQLKRVSLLLESHSSFDLHHDESIDAIVYNLGYLPGSDKNKTTQSSSSIESLKEACRVLKSGGIISLTAYPGHTEGKVERDALLQWLINLPPQEWNLCHHKWDNRNLAPELILIQKAL